MLDQARATRFHFTLAVSLSLLLKVMKSHCLQTYYNKMTELDLTLMLLCWDSECCLAS